jgi:hypothetical protein
LNDRPSTRLDAAFAAMKIVVCIFSIVRSLIMLNWEQAWSVSGRDYIYARGEFSPLRLGLKYEGCRPGTKASTVLTVNL